ncbi:site-specific DNA-methyltransferase [Cryobacterium sp. TMT2-4]|uniref:site-specific DNA-methyltransferase n=1 Tax=Cryobacterium sp. TMT2-4 TaxID=1259254 RepID=UPI00106BD7D6|nr:site-specific DNA-methyltransferase [Cryobacterium sp. TMT2-4]TFC63854.1 site-specific DNA-methyltransferase [Cryobacterium sp. TMT2-4]
MATIDDLINKIEDPSLRARLAEQVRVLTERKEFGLVFQDHTPEAIEVPGLAPRRDDIVRRRGDTGRVNHTVRSVSGHSATIVELDEFGGVAGEQFKAGIDELVLVKDFGQPIYAGLKSLGRTERGGDKPSHLVIQGENYYALETLMYTHENKVDVIYIDPPYNTGSADWIYNDRFVDGQDAYRHSKWLSFMQRRLKHAKRLLKATGVIIIAIDDNEQARLKLLCDQVLGAQNFVANVVWNGGRKNDSRFVSVGHDYMLIYAQSVESLNAANLRWREPRPGLVDIREAAARSWATSGGDVATATLSMKLWIANLPAGHAAKENNRFYEFEDDGRVFRKRDVSWPGGGGPTYDVLHPITGLPVRLPSRGWIFSKPERMQEEIDAGRIMWGADHTEFINRKTYLDEGEMVVPTSVFERKRTSSTKYLEAILGSKDFPFPKDVDVVGRWVNLVSAENSDAIVLDFFAGTGTTAEAVMRLNAQDGGRRQAILVTNNEVGAKAAAALSKAGALPGDPAWEAEGVFQKVTRPRLETVVTGIRGDGSTFSDGLSENIEFLELTYEDPDLIQLGQSFTAIAPLLWVKAGATGSVIVAAPESGWAINSDGSYGVLFDVKHSADFTADARRNAPTLRHAFIITNQESAYKQIVSSLPAQSRSFSATRLYGDYLRTFEINGKD